jgi:catechol-2,3-dioxygenase
MEAMIERLVACFERGELSRRQLIGGVAALAAAASNASAAEPAPQPSTFRAVGLNHLALRITEIPRSRDFYIRHLGMEVMSESASSCFLRCGEHFVALFRRELPGMDHYCYSVEGYTVTGAADRLRAQGFEPRVTGNRIYFPDPDGIIVQLAALGSMG